MTNDTERDVASRMEGHRTTAMMQSSSGSQSTSMQMNSGGSSSGTEDDDVMPCGNCDAPIAEPIL